MNLVKTASANRLGTITLMAIGATLASAAQANLLQNGGFEQPGGCASSCVLLAADTSISGWTTFLSGVEYLDPRFLGVGPAPEGSMVVDLANFTYPQGGGIHQTFGTVAGAFYTLSFSAGNALFDGRLGTGTVRVEVAGQDITFNTPVATSITGVWQTLSFDFQATASQTTLRFSNQQDPLLHFAVIDQISVIAATPVPEPATAGLWLLGLAALGIAVGRSGRRQSAGGFVQ